MTSRKCNVDLIHRGKHDRIVIGFPIQSRVVLHSLVQKPELNGKGGVVMSVINKKSGRQRVFLAPVAEQPNRRRQRGKNFIVNVKPSNLKLEARCIDHLSVEELQMILLVSLSKESGTIESAEKSRIRNMDDFAELKSEVSVLQLESPEQIVDLLALPEFSEDASPSEPFSTDNSATLHTAKKKTNISPQTKEEIQRKRRRICPICCLVLPICESETVYMGCCGETVCGGCIHLNRKATKKLWGQKDTCPFCRHLPASDSAQVVSRLQQRSQRFQDPHAFFQLAVHHRRGSCGLVKDAEKSFEMLQQAVDFATPRSNPAAALRLSNAYQMGIPEAGIPVDNVRCREYLEIAAYIGSNVQAWYQLGRLYYSEATKTEAREDEAIQQKNENMESAIYHFRIAASYGCDPSMKILRETFYNQRGLITREDYKISKLAWETAKEEMSSPSRSEAKNLNAWKRRETVFCKQVEEEVTS